MNAGGVHLLALALPTLAAGGLMMLAGTEKKFLVWRETRQRCPVCGRTDRHDCSPG